MCVSYTHMYDAPNSSFLSLTRFHLFSSFESGEEAARNNQRQKACIPSQRDVFLWLPF